MAKARNAARVLLTLDPHDPRRIFEGGALLRRLQRIGCLTPEQNKLDYVLGLTDKHLLERRLQTLVYKLNMAKSIHHARVLIQQRHITVGKQMVDVPSFIVRVDNQTRIRFASVSPFGGGKPGRVKARNLKRANAPAEAQEDEE